MNGKLSSVVYSAPDGFSLLSIRWYWLVRSEPNSRAAFSWIAERSFSGSAGCQVFPPRFRYRPPEFSDSAKPRCRPRKREGVFRWGRSPVRENRLLRVDRSANRRAHCEWLLVLSPAPHP